MFDDLISRKQAQEAILKSKAIMFVPDKEIAAEALNGVPVAGSVEIVRCKDCKKRNTDDCSMYWQCYECNAQYSWENDDDFCSWGERRANP